ncbi:SGNH/GDSL hydrolase family protein [Gammaproteobacteria bacterium]|nr:SGNH/GDSL hydrolase family protein [Gammaproteobacteria bacterium]
MTNLILLGDSIFDNGVYVPGEPALVTQLNSLLIDKSRATLLAVDGHITRDVVNQARQIPGDATHLFVSVGGNDALGAVHILHHEGSAQEVLHELTLVQNEFRTNYTLMLDNLRERNLPFTVCTVYDSVPDMEQITHDSAVAALSLFNDVIVREAVSRGLPIIDLRSVCDSHEDYSNVSPIEPSAIGGEKIARAIRNVFMHHNFNAGQSAIFGHPSIA